ncbi:FAD-dependent oxidoreductase [Arthrobacter sp. I2-34]|uniref:FAD-dependent oxidoreductase n=1 Tax=Arthrobacter hankyongi TaxID=2904801 RepID=A0ABS9L2Z1_9MICC|nr:FAD-dependent oxidoreductase [Arthrobacter hankyongi]MCG2620998.1 FAD-dependent oxidoreductase [Arthrobacter hankyongi]
MRTLAIVGASLAGLSAARAARAQGFDGNLVIIGDEDERPYDRPPLSKEFLQGRITAADLALEAAEEDLQAEWLLGSRATRLDGPARTLTLADGRTVAADGIVLATGASARTLPELAGLDNVFSLRTLADARALSTELQPGRRLVVVGAGFIGAEVASTAKALGLEVTVLEARPVPLSGPLGAQMGAVVGRLHGLNGVELICGTGIDLFYSGEGVVTGLRLADGRYLPADLVLVGIGAVPNTGWLAGSGVAAGNGVVCDASGRTNLPGIVAVGDCAAWFDPRLNAHRRVEHWTTALEHPEAAVAALLDQPAPQSVKVPYFWSDQYGVKLQFAGNAAQADRVAIEAGDLQEHNVLALYYRGEDPVAVLGLNQPRLFTKWRRTLNALPAAAAVPA